MRTPQKTHNQIEQAVAIGVLHRLGAQSARRRG
jgi:hypothetical protein